MQTVITQQPALRVIEGGGAQGHASPDIPPRPMPRMAAQELAAEIAELFVFALAQDIAPAALADPHAEIRIDRALRVTLHDLLCELRSLPWFDPACTLPELDSETARRRANRLAPHGQMTLRTLANCGIPAWIPPGITDPMTLAHAPEAAPVQPPQPPAREAPMSHWLRWCAVRSGAGLSLPGRDRQAAAPGSLAGLARELHRVPAARPFHNLALAALARGTAFDPGLSGWRGGDLFALMAEAERQAARLGLLQAGHVDRMARPAVTAARLSVALCPPQRGSGGDPLIVEAAEALAQHAPRLVDWMTRANRARRGKQRIEVSLFLPLCAPDALPPHPSDMAVDALVAGALATLVKAVFDTTGGPSALRMVDAATPDPGLARAADGLVANVALARAVSGGYFPAETMRDMRLGQAIALRLLRDTLERDNLPVELALRDLDGRHVRIHAVTRTGGRGHAMLGIDGVMAHWPGRAGGRPPHLTAVV